ncbi:hypothetical protein LOAG_07524 [Loa loa]|uniref:Uncharacterized protein n=1 Tax=Loa loa TaxID=7209 RepID=A0A1S0TVE4_LOALO|nr:hypothetical protein LOAG_07524 [Loa loa]EFO20964.1 hypothetical protein LOAG_07524 [Loa loa]
MLFVSSYGIGGRRNSTFIFALDAKTLGECHSCQHSRKLKSNVDESPTPLFHTSIVCSMFFLCEQNVSNPTHIACFAGDPYIVASKVQSNTAYASGMIYRAFLDKKREEYKGYPPQPSCEV